MSLVYNMLLQQLFRQQQQQQQPFNGPLSIPGQPESADASITQ